ncbi:MAG: hypothetical protein KDC95_07805 [Planctomycetes bacterium]|nr:hypothetical protein [Planctomycetota bacterium]
MKLPHLFTVTATVLLAGSTVAQSVSSTYSRSFGNSNLGGSLSVTSYAGVSRSGTTYTASAYVRGSAVGKLLGYSKEFGYAYAGLSAKKTASAISGSASVSLRVAGKTLYSSSWSRSYATSKTWATPTYSVKVFPVDPSAKFTVGPIPITVKGNAGAAANLSATARIATSLSNFASLTGTARAWGNGTASVTAGIKVLSLGVELSAKYANQSLNLSTYLNSTGPHGRFYYTLQAIALKLKVKIKVLFASYSKTIAEYASSTYTRTFWSR